MANPQCENGFTKIANEILEALAGIRIPGEARQIFDTILRKTYGFHKKDDAISLSQFVLSTNIKKPNICASLKQLKKMNLVIQKDNDISNIYSINKDYTSWRPLSKRITLSKKIMTVIQKDNKSLSKRIPTIDNIQKIILQKIKTYCPNSKEFVLSELLLSKILARRPNCKKPNIQTWCHSIHKMINIDKRDPVEIERIIIWCQNDIFWQNNILSTDKLRKQYDQLALKMSNKPKTLEEKNLELIEKLKKEGY